jgi:hypothetical protein
MGVVNRELAQHHALRSDDGVEVAIRGGDIVVRRGGWLAELLVAERRLPMALATAHDADDVVRSTHSVSPDSSSKASAATTSRLMPRVSAVTHVPCRCRREPGVRPNHPLALASSRRAR